MILPSFDSIEKKEARRIASPLRTISHGLFLPSSYALDLRQFQAEGLIGSETQLTLVENNPKIMAQMQSSVQSLGLTNQASYYLGKLESLMPAPLDYAYIDLLGTMSRSLVYWLDSILSKSLMPHSRVAITLHGNFRNSAFMKQIQHEFLNSPTIYDEICRTTGELIGKRDEVLHNITTYMILLEACLGGVKWRSVSQYINSKSPMVLLVMDVVEPNPSRTSLLNDVHNTIRQLEETSLVSANAITSKYANSSYSQQVSNPKEPMMDKKKMQSEAGRKSWETRRANQAKAVQKITPEPLGTPGRITGYSKNNARGGVLGRVVGYPKPTPDHFQQDFKKAYEALANGKRNAQALIERYVANRCEITGQDPNRVRAAVKAAASRLSSSR